MVDRDISGLLLSLRKEVTALKNRRFRIPARLGAGEQLDDWQNITRPGRYWGENALNAPDTGLVAAIALRSGDRLLVVAYKSDVGTGRGREWRNVFWSGGWAGWQAFSEEDSDWVTLPPATGFSSWSPNETPAVRKIGNRVYFKGLVKANSGNMPTSEYVPFAAGAIPVSMRFNPAKYGQNGLFSGIGSAANQQADIRVRSDGGITVRPSTVAATYLGLYTISYFAD